ncbi:MAG TPA: efflux RND transporter periplasmic adaptor subunit [Bacteroidia bacterium]|nr:efflux RND transporter periplasmic adaptor subunit [Bacteroidia bacterium]HRS59371.1 efflux RND transporter periplasmic adaptor subunit [Bacteroidia bacterium]HRU68829.1 efflux RND transporter periplasmic adaptor subunit [Bacteroidia bacterium]
MKPIYLLALSLVFLFISCSKQVDPTEKLNKLIAERDKLNQEIVELQKQISKNDTLKDEKMVKILEISPKEFKSYIRVQGRVDGDENAAVNTKVVGVIKNILVKTGDRVTKGQVLATLDDEVLQSSLKELRAQYEFTLTVYERQKRLWDQKIGSEIQYLTAKNNKEAMENRIKSLQEQINMYKLTAPVSGTVEDVSIKIGQAVSPGLALMRIVNFSKMKVVAEVSETYSSKIKKGDEVEIIFPDIPYTTRSQISFASKFINPVNRTFIVEAQIPSSVTVSANMVAVLNINDYKKTDAIVVPDNLILNENGEKFIYVAEDQNGKLVVARKKIVTGRSYKGETEILQGVDKNIRLIASDLQRIEEGQIVKPL